MHVDGPQGALGIDPIHRPLAGEVLWVGMRFAGESPLLWQIFSLALRWLGGVSVWLFGSQLWPSRKDYARLIAMLFVLYPGFGQQFIAVNSSRHLFPLITFFASLTLTIIAVRKSDRYSFLTGMALLLSLITMLTTEYYYGLEFIRPIVIWLLSARPHPAPGIRLKRTVLKWLPYLLLQSAVFYWRYTVSLDVNYAVSLNAGVLSLEGLLQVAATVLRDLFTTTLLVWWKALLLPAPETFGVRKTILYWLVVLSAALLTWFYFKFSAPGERLPKAMRKQAVMLGLLALLTSGLPFLAANLDVSDSFPNDRLSLPFMLGASLLMASVLQSLPAKTPRNFLAALLIGLFAGVQVQTAASYKDEWEKQTAFFEQLSWRIPGLNPNTAILSLELPIAFASDNSLTAPLNWLYAPDFDSTGSLPFLLLNLEIRTGSKIPDLTAGVPIEMEYKYFFKGSMDQIVLIHFSPPGCVRILDPRVDRFLPQTPDLLDVVLPLSDLSNIIPDAASPAQLPDFYGGPAQTGSWCYYFEKADLARQLGHWEEIVTIGDIAFKLSDSPNKGEERLPFIEGYAHTGDWEQAYQLTAETFRINKFTGKLLCETWMRLSEGTQESAEKERAFRRLEELLACGFPADS